MSKQEFFDRKEIKENYAHYRDGVYRLTGEAVVKGAYYLHWDHLHNDVEVYSKTKKHMGLLAPETLKLYKSPVLARLFPLS